MPFETLKTHLDEAILLKPREDGEAQAESHGISEGDQDGNRLTRDGPIAVNDVGKRDGRSSTENGVENANTGDRDHGLKMVPDPKAPQRQTNRSEKEDWHEAPEPIFWLKVSLSAFRYRLEQPVATWPKGTTNDHADDGLTNSG